MKVGISIDIRKKDEWGLVGFEFGNTHRYIEKNIDLRFPNGELASNENLCISIQQAVSDCLGKEMLKELKEEDSWRKDE